jgi:hypothetical protein
MILGGIASVTCERLWLPRTSAFYSATSSERTRFKSRSISEVLFLNQSVDQIRCIAHP